MGFQYPLRSSRCCWRQYQYDCRGEDRWVILRGRNFRFRTIPDRRGDVQSAIDVESGDIREDDILEITDSPATGV